MGELIGAVAWYEAKQDGLGLDLQTKVEEAVERIREHPSMHSVYNEQGVHKCLVKRFPFTIFFHELDDAIWIAAVAHQKRKPDYWTTRSEED
ncbi:MAG: type II toxin-antitoxin system RelE/ParE family toxin [Gemmataceae bacterium]|nr:type II toxin-antitoxin system RelE/ParE family toxin [Gemmataceae bacterium]